MLHHVITYITIKHCVTCYNHYIFDSTQTHAVIRSDENLKFLLGDYFHLTAAIEYAHNAPALKPWKDSRTKRR